MQCKVELIMQMRKGNGEEACDEGRAVGAMATLERGRKR